MDADWLSKKIAGALIDQFNHAMPKQIPGQLALSDLNLCAGLLFLPDEDSKLYRLVGANDLIAVRQDQTVGSRKNFKDARFGVNYNLSIGMAPYSVSYSDADKVEIFSSLDELMPTLPRDAFLGDPTKFLIICKVLSQQPTDKHIFSCSETILSLMNHAPI